MSKLIKKVAQSFAVVGKVLNSKSTSTQDTYSCDYIDNSFEQKVEKTSITNSCDFDNLTNGIYQLVGITTISGSSNYPVDVTSNLDGILINFAYDGSVIMQIYYNQSLHAIYSRVKWYSWRSWIKISN